VIFNSILIGTDDAPRLIEYYRKLFGEPQMSDESYTGWAFGTGFVTVGAHSEVQGKNAHPGRLIWNLETPDVRGEFTRLQEAGAIVIREPYNFPDYPNSWIATLADPDDNYFQLMSPMEEMSQGG
jgi:predicted enzyme related to lactoylglutathione lyase